MRLRNSYLSLLLATLCHGGTFAVLPNGRFANIEEATARFEAMRARSIQVAQERAAELYSLASKHPRFGPVNGVELMIELPIA